MLAAAGYDAASDAVTVRFSDGITVSLPRELLQGLENGTSAQLAEVEIEGPMGLYWPTLDVAHDVPGLLSGIFGTRRWLAENGRRGGSARTPAKARAAKINGGKGGRPVGGSDEQPTKGFFTDAQSIGDAPVMHEDLLIQRRPVGEAVHETLGADETIRIPLIREEVVNVEKRVVVTESVTIGKRTVSGVQSSGANRQDELCLTTTSRNRHVGKLDKRRASR